MIRRFSALASLISLFLLLPKYRRAFRKAFEETDLTLLQYDEYDRYWSCFYASYDYRGKTFLEREKQSNKMVNEFNFRVAKKHCSICHSTDETKLLPDKKKKIIRVLCMDCQSSLKHWDDETLLTEALNYIKQDAI
jgi:hypothetical protein